MSVTPKVLNKSAIDNKEIQTIVKDYLNVIDEALQKHQVNWGKNTVKFRLPDKQEFQGLSRAQSQKILYSAIIKSLIDRGFEVKISITADASILFISWVTEIDEIEFQEMNCFLKEFIITKELK